MVVVLVVIVVAEEGSTHICNLHSYISKALNLFITGRTNTGTEKKQRSLMNIFNVFVNI